MAWGSYFKKSRSRRPARPVAVNLVLQRTSKVPWDPPEALPPTFSPSRFLRFFSGYTDLPEVHAGLDSSDRNLTGLTSRLRSQNSGRGGTSPSQPGSRTTYSRHWRAGTQYGAHLPDSLAHNLLRESPTSGLDTSISTLFS